MRTGIWLGIAAAVALTAGTQAQAPQGSTALCKDGTYSQAATRKQACKANGGVKTWFPTDGGADKAPAGTLNAAPGADQANMDGMTQKAPKRPARPTPAALPNGGTTRPQAPGAGPGLVWVDAKTNRYYCAADPNYGRTKTGKYVSESDAKTSGASIAKNQNCSVQ
ncbi:DUF3761 domain-containing protein [Terriglobus aquaticus]|uniref:DUF3761 domain-containing protein n=1 Tax=Terriglobus aquaticus TaxID=940139 RepID=A0ABW9KQN1_9BACT|nr:DUF3761 domain-containing protein [Terriglobus aquaticus]